jgi:hypothetical protein
MVHQPHSHGKGKGKQNKNNSKAKQNTTFKKKKKKKKKKKEEDVCCFMCGSLVNGQRSAQTAKEENLNLSRRLQIW